jgi:hypothetical protein
MKIYIPIGSNCEIAHFLKSKNLRFFAFPFDWNCAPLKSIYNLLLNNFDLFLENIFIGERIHRLYFDDNETETKIEKDFIYPVICKKYLILFPHDYKSMDHQSLADVKQKYKKRIERFNNTMSNDELEIVMVYCNIDFNLNEWQKSVYDKFIIDTELLKKDNDIFIDKIKKFYNYKKNFQIISLEELILIV